MADLKRSLSEMEARMKNLEEELKVTHTEKMKLQVRLKGYETFSQLAQDEQIENTKLKKKVNELQEELAELEKVGGNASPRKDLSPTELQSRTQAQLPSGRVLESRYFSVIAKPSRDSYLVANAGHAHAPTQESGFNPIPCPIKQTVELNANEPINTSVTVGSHAVFPNATEAVMTKSGNGSLRTNGQPEGGKGRTTPLLGLSGELIQVFPQASQSGGSNSFGSSIDQELEGCQSCTNSSRRGPVSMMAIGLGSYSSQFDEDKRDVGRKSSAQLEDLKAHNAPCSPEDESRDHTTLFEGTGARPKFVTQCESNAERNVDPGDLKPFNSVPDKTLMVAIPEDQNQEMYRVNNKPMLSYGKQNSQTEISGLTSFGSSLPSSSLEKIQGSEMPYNNLNMNSQPSPYSSPQLTIPAVATEEEYTDMELSSQFVKTILKGYNGKNYQGSAIILKETKGNIEYTKDQERQPTEIGTSSDEIDKEKIQEKRMIVEVEQLRAKTKLLYSANKEWKDKWDKLTKQTEDEKWQLLLRMKELTSEKERLKQESDSFRASAQEELHRAYILKQEADLAYFNLTTAQSQDKTLLQKLTQDFGNLHHEKRVLEVQVEFMKSQISAEDATKPLKVSHSELEVELRLVKRQVTICREDFDKEHKERMASEKRFKKETEMCHSLETKLKKAHALLKSRDEDLRSKSKLVADLKFQIDDLKLKLEVEQRRSCIYPSIMSPTTTGPNREANENSMSMLNVLNPSVPQINMPPWSCHACTFLNTKPTRKCQMCGSHRPRKEGRFIELDG